MDALQQKVKGLKVLSFHFAVCFAEQHTVGFSQSSLIHLVGPLDCTLHNYVHGGQSRPLGLFSSLMFSGISEPVCYFNIFWIDKWIWYIDITTIFIYFTSQKVSTIILLLLLFFYCDACTFRTWPNGVRMRELQQRINTGEQAEVQRKQTEYINRSQARSVRHICNEQLNMSRSHIQRVDINPGFLVSLPLLLC